MFRSHQPHNVSVAVGAQPVVMVARIAWLARKQLLAPGVGSHFE